MPEPGTALKLAALVLSLGLDTLAVAIALGISGLGGQRRVQAALTFASFEGGMPLVGFLLGRAAGQLLGRLAADLGLVVLFGVGVWMIVEGLRGEEEVRVASTGSLLLTGLAVSLDELAIGFSMGSLALPVPLTVLLIAAQAFLLTLLGSILGRRLGEELAERAELAAGVVLAALAVVLAAGHL